METLNGDVAIHYHKCAIDRNYLCKISDRHMKNKRFSCPPYDFAYSEFQSKMKAVVGMTETIGGRFVREDGWA